jgi:hypothetical protein
MYVTFVIFFFAAPLASLPLGVRGLIPLYSCPWAKKCNPADAKPFSARYQGGETKDRSCLIGIEFLALWYPEFKKEPKIYAVGAVLAMLRDEYSLWRSTFELHPKAAESEKTELR